MGWKDNLKKRVKEAAQGHYFTAEANNTVRILQNVLGPEEPPTLEFLAHRDVGPDKRFLRCGKDYETREGKCWLCDKAIPSLEKSDKASRRAMAEAIKPQSNCVLQIGVLDHESGAWTGPIAWLLSIGGPKTLWAQVMNLLLSTRRNYDDPKKGYNISFTRTGTGMKTKYGNLEPDDEPTPADPTLLKKRKKLEDLISAYSEKEQQNAFYGKRDDEVEEEEEEETTEEETAEEEEETTEEEAAEEEESEEEAEEVGEDEAEEEEEAAEEEEGAEEEEEEEVEEEEEEGPTEEELEEGLDAEEAEAEEEEEEAPPPPVKKKTPPVTKKAAAPPAKSAQKASPPPATKKAATPPPPPAKKGAVATKKKK